jgi:hypothetical protein
VLVQEVLDDYARRRFSRIPKQERRYDVSELGFDVDKGRDRGVRKRVVGA